MAKPRLIIVIAIIAIFIWTIFAPPSFLKHIKTSLINAVGLPLKIASRSLSYIIKISSFPHIGDERLRLEQRISELEKALAESEEVLLENKRLRDLLGFKQTAEKYSTPALIIGRDPTNWSSIVFIDKGEKQGIVEDMVVISGQGLAGRVREPGRMTSKVMLINDIDSKVGAIVQRNRDQGLLIGTPENKCKLIYLSLDSDVKEDDIVLTSGMGGIYPKGILVGRVIKVEKERGRLYKYAIVEPSSELSKLEEVLCIK